MKTEIIAIPLTSKNKGEASSVDLDSVITLCQMGENIADAGRKIKPYLARYLHALGAKTAVIENNYVDHDYLDDYSNYYAKCFDAPPRLCARVHFFSDAYKEDELRQIVASPDAEGSDSPKDAEKLQNHYLGFVVFRPLSRAFVGRTCLKPLSLESGQALRTVHVSFWGVGLHVDAMPFQEQDTATAACATCALWSSSQVTASLFGHTAYSPSSITAMAGGHKTSEMRVFPNCGLSLTDMIYAVRCMTLDPIHVGVNAEHVNQRQDILLGNIYAYLGMRVPILLIGILRREDGSRCGDGAHAVVVTGYSQSEGVENPGYVVVSSGIRGLFVHDDQVGPYASIVFEQKMGDETSFACPCKGKCAYAIGAGAEEAIRWKTEWKANDESLYFSPTDLIIPVYNKIRVSYEDVLRHVMEIHDALQEVIKCLQEAHRLPEDPSVVPQWSIQLRTCCDYKKSVRNDPGIRHQQDKLALLTMALPKYLWEIKMLAQGKVNAMFVVDATDSGCGMHVIGAYFYCRSLEEMWNWLLCANGDSRMLMRNPLMVKLKEIAG